MLELINFILLCFAIAFWFKISKAATAMIEAEKHLRMMAWEAQKLARERNTDGSQQ